VLAVGGDARAARQLLQHRLDGNEPQRPGRRGCFVEQGATALETVAELRSGSGTTCLFTPNGVRLGFELAEGGGQLRYPLAQKVDLRSIDLHVAPVTFALALRDARTLRRAAWRRFDGRGVGR
jgi:hypothetical protein